LIKQKVVVVYENGNGNGEKGYGKERKGRRGEQGNGMI
jgi:hypothetical protein